MPRTLRLTAAAFLSLAACAKVNTPGRDEPVPQLGDTTHAAVAAQPTDSMRRPAGHVLVTFSDPSNRDQLSPSAMRGGDGRPGPAYWQQRANYEIEATLDTSAKKLSGHVTVHYINNSPDTLRYVWM